MADKKTQLVLEATITNTTGEMTGREWDVTLIGPKTASHLIKKDGREFVLSENGRLYRTDALEGSATLFEGVKVYDNHLTPEEFERKRGMRSPNTEWLGSIVNVRFDRATRSLKGVFKVVEDSLARKLKNAYEQGVLNSIGLSIDTFTQLGKEVDHEGRLLPVIESFKKILSVDLVGEPAAGGGFNRILAAKFIDDMEIENMSEETTNQYVTKDELGDIVSQAVKDALATAASETELEDAENLDDSEVSEALKDISKSKLDKNLSEAEVQLAKVKRLAEAEQLKANLARTQYAIEQKLAKAKLPEKFEAAIRLQFEGRVVESAAIQSAIDAQRAAYASLDPTGRVSTGGISDVRPGIEQEERFALAFMERMMGTSDFRALESNPDQSVKDRLMDFKPYKSWINNGKPELPRYNRMSTLLYEYFGGDPFMDGRAMEAATTSSLASVVKNTVNIMAANSYSQRELWWEPIVRTMEVDTIDDATLARIYGVNALSVVPEGTAYTELNLADEEETAVFVKHGNYIEITLETLMRDKIQYVQRIPQVLADTWYNTQADSVSAVFTLNSATGPVLADSGALFNATATTTPGGHANLLTAALNHANYALARTAMQKQTDQPLGAGRRVGIRPRFLLVPVDLEKAAEEIRVSSLVPGADTDTANAGAQTANIYKGDFQTIVVPTWTDATDWALVADPAFHPAIWMIYPRGQRTPQIFAADNETSGSMFTNDTLRFKARLMLYRFSSTYPTAPVSDFRPLHKSNVGG